MSADPEVPTPLDALPLVDIASWHDLDVRLEFRDGWRRPLDSVRAVEVWTRRAELIARLPGALLQTVVGQYVVNAMLTNALAVRLPVPAGPARELPQRQRRRRRDSKPGPYVAVGDRAAAVRHRLGLDWPAFAQRLGCSRMTVVRLERGEFLPKLTTVQRVAAVGGVSVEWLLTGRDRAPLALAGEDRDDALTRDASLHAAVAREGGSRT